MFTQIKLHMIELAGTAAGFSSGVFLMVKNQINVLNDLHAVIIAFMTGAAGGLGALVIKWLWNKYIKKKS